MGNLRYFLGLEVDCTPTGIHVTQRKYTTDLLTKYGMNNAKTCVIPIALQHVCDVGSPCCPDDAKSFRAIV